MVTNGLNLQVRPGFRLYPGLTQSLKILAVPTVELETLLRSTAAANPCLEVTEAEPSFWRPVGEAEGLGIVSPWGDFFAELKSDTERRIGEYLVGLLDEGYLRVAVPEIARALDAPVDLVEGVLRALQDQDPPGLGARDLRECFLLQARRQGAAAVVLEALEKHFDLVLGGHHRELAHRLGISRAELGRVLTAIKRLNPKPGLPGGEPGHPLRPDLLVVERDGRLEVEMVDEGARVNISPYYLKLYRDTVETEVREFLRANLRTASWLVRQIERRRETLKRLGELIVLEQEGFFHRGRPGLRPLTISGAASRLGVAQSTLSRAVSDKYLGCKRGLFPLRFFFQGRLGGGHSPESAKALILELIRAEGWPLTDEHLARLLRDRGVVIARRTVAKYRRQLGLKSSRRRGKRHG